MLKLPEVTKEELEVLKNKKIIIYTLNGKGNVFFLYQILKELEIDIIGVYIEKLTLGAFLKCILQGVHIINTKKLETLVKKYDNLLVQGLDDGIAERRNEIRKKVNDFGLELTCISSGQLITFFGYHCINKFRNSFWYQYKKVLLQMGIKRSVYCKEMKKFIGSNSLMIICSPPKTADHTLNYTMEQLEKRVKYCNVWHRPRVIKPQKFNKLKIIMGVRDPILQNFSFFYQILGAGLRIDHWILRETYNKDTRERNNLINEYETLFRKNGNNIQIYWNKYIESFIYPFKAQEVPVSIMPTGIQEFIQEFQENVFDILTKPFNKEKGCDILREGNIEVFVYQLEKLNSVIPELSDFVGVPFTTLVDGNKAEDKWIGESYKQACKEIEITQEYFDKCYNEPYVKHFYSEEDIEKFKERWRSHIV